MIALKPGTATWDMLGKVDSLLLLMAADAHRWLELYGVKVMTITSIIRPQGGDSGVHALGRAIDISIHGIPTTLLPELKEYLDTKYPYDPSRPEMKSCILHVGMGYATDKAEHIHLQVL